MEVGQLLNLQVLAFNGNELTGLYLDDTRIATLFKTPCFPSCLGSIPAEVGQLSNLKKLCLDNNQLAGLCLGDTSPSSPLWRSFDLTFYRADSNRGGSNGKPKDALSPRKSAVWLVVLFF